MKTLFAFTGLVAIIQLSQACPMIYSPVCGTDGNTYPNECFMNVAAYKQNKKITVAQRGKCGSSKCLQEALEATQSHLLGRFTPRCNQDGTYQLVQCHASTAYCWCSSPDGTKFPGTDVRFEEPNCDKYKAVPKLASFLALPGAVKPTLSKCQQEAGVPITRTSRALVGRFTPKCNEDGTYQLVQCHGSTGYCWCTAPDGTKYPGTDVPPGRKIDCDMYKTTKDDKCKNVKCPSPYAKCRVVSGKAECYCPLACPLIYYPVCGTDGKTYSNDCVMRSQACQQKKIITVVRAGKCEEDPCKNVQCSRPFAKCHVINGKPQCQCQKMCTLEYAPVCGSDGKTYGNLCMMTSHACLQNKRITMTRRDECEGPCIKAMKKALGLIILVRGEPVPIHPNPYIPTCDKNGLFTPKQCNKTSGECWCADKYGEELVNTRKQTGDVTCEADPCKNIQCSRPYAKCHVINDQPQCQCQKICTMEYAPVCGTDGKTYANLCLMTSHACRVNKTITMATKGECEENECKNVDCSSRPYSQCRVVSGKPQCRCQLACTREYFPVCGSDGKTYGNLCMLTAHACEKNELITVTRTEECDKKQAQESLVQANYQTKQSKNSHTRSSDPSGSTTTIVVLSVCAALCAMVIVGVVVMRRRRGRASHEKQDSCYTTIGEKRPLVET